MVEKDGWMLARFKGSHRQYIHRGRPEAGTLTIAGHPADEVPRGLLHTILKQTGLTK